MTRAGDPGDFAVGRCPECAREVLTYPDGEPSAESETRRCIHCDERLGGVVRWIDAADLEGLGYVVDSGEEDAGGCASCGNGACGVKLRSETSAAR